jgi:hypothetical protein
VFNYRLRDGLPCCLGAFAVEGGWDKKFVSRISHVVKLNVGNEERGENTSGHGGRRISGVLGLLSSDHDIEPVKRMWASAWFTREKALIAQAQPNEKGTGIFQHDRIDVGLYYELYTLCCQDLWGLSKQEIASQPLWHLVWTNDHSDLVFRAHLNVDHKDKAVFLLLLFIYF